MGAKGRVGSAMTVHTVRGPKCKHRWTAWRRAGILDSTMRRDCRACGRIQTKKAKPSDP